MASCVSLLIKQDILSHQWSSGLIQAQMENSENMEIYFDCQPLLSVDEMDREMALSMPENYIVPSNYCTILTELLILQSRIPVSLLFITTYDTLQVVFWRARPKAWCTHCVFITPFLLYQIILYNCSIMARKCWQHTLWLKKKVKNVSYCSILWNFFYSSFDRVSFLISDGK